VLRNRIAGYFQLEVLGEVSETTNSANNNSANEPTNNPYADDLLRRAWSGGYQARRSGRPRTECPYKPSDGATDTANAWLRGWIAANLEDQFGVDGSNAL